jgi:hypothetical protein
MLLSVVSFITLNHTGLQERGQDSRKGESKELKKLIISKSV